MSLLFTPVEIGSSRARNRLWVAPMCQYSATDGMPNTWHLTHLAAFATGGAGLVMTEATAVSPEGRISPDDTGIWNDAQRDAWRPIAAEIRARGALAAIQLAHAGRKASTWSPLTAGTGTVPAAAGGWQALAPSPVAYDGYATPQQLDIDGIAKVIADFGAAARRSVDAGFDVLEVHAAHGYLLHEFLSPLSNQRTDEYGGSLANRARLLLEVLDAVRAAAPATAVMVRFSATDWADGGWDLGDTTTVAAWAAERGAVFVDISSGGLVAHQRLVVGPGYQVPFAREVREKAGVPVAAVGLITTGTQAEEVLRSGAADAVMAGREWLRDPHFALRAATELGAEIDYWPPQYERARIRRAS
jgi:2,4-dienoyl-CoA reductase-like NADH-dependent reductase (Old Yellow Enzyme family)